MYFEIQTSSGFIRINNNEKLNNESLNQTRNRNARLNLKIKFIYSQIYNL